MADRPIEALWPSLVDSTGTPGTGTKVKKATFDDLLAALVTSLYDAALEEGPPEIASEMVNARGGYSNLDARLDAIQAAAAGGAATNNVYPGSLNVVPNDGFLVWSAGDSAAPDLWAVDASLTVGREDFDAIGTPQEIYGRNVVALTNPDGTERTFYIDLLSSTDLSTYQGGKIKSAKVAAGAFLYSATPSLMEVEVDDGSTAHQVGEQGSTADAWVWSGATNPSFDGGATLGAGATRLRLAIRMKGAGTGYVAAPALVQGFDALSRWPGPTPIIPFTASWSLGDDGQVATGNKAAWYTESPVLIRRGRVIAMGSAATGTYVMVFEKDGTEILNFNFNSGSDTGWTSPATTALASCARGAKLGFAVDTAATDLLGPAFSVQGVKVIEPLREAGMVA